MHCTNLFHIPNITTAKTPLIQPVPGALKHPLQPGASVMFDNVKFIKFWKTIY